MSGEPKATVEPEEQPVCFHVVCLIDVLGQKQKLAQWARPPDDKEAARAFAQSLDDTVHVLRTLRDTFVQWFEDKKKPKVPQRLAKSPGSLQARYSRLRRCDIRVERFSDTFVFSSPVLNEHGDTSVMPAMRMLMACHMAMILSLAGGVPLRGALTIGLVNVLPDKSIYGPALAEGHHLESEIAGYPRIVVSKGMRDFLATGQPRSRDSHIDGAMETLASTCRGCLSEDVDGQWIFDYLGDGAREAFGLFPGMPKVAEEALTFARSEGERFRQAGNSKLALRYHLLESYITCRMDLWR